MSTDSLNVRKVLVPLDFSDPSLQALQYARRFAEPSKAELILLYVIEPVAYPAELGVVINLDADLAERALGELEKLRQQHLGVQFRRVAPAVQELDHAIEKYPQSHSPIVPKVIRSSRARCRSRKISTTGRAIISERAASWLQGSALLVV